MKTIEWVAATVAVAAATVFGIMRFAYSDFETQRSTDIYRGQIEKRLDSIEQGQDKLSDKLDRIILRLPPR
jgi:hypothetical protein